LLGSPEQVHLARQFAREFAAKGHAPLDPLLEALRLELRQELALDPLGEGIVFLRINTVEKEDGGDLGSVDG
jgi:hypothetical protein